LTLIAEKPAPFTPAMRLLLRRMARASYPPYYTLSAPAARRANEKSAGILEIAPPAMERVDDFDIPVRAAAQLGARLFVPSDAAGLPVLLYFHGGGFCIGSVNTHDVLCRALAHESGAAVLSVDYRLAPEHRFPTAVNDAWDALQWLLERGAAQFELDAKRVAIGGDSAGGTLAADSAIHARDLGLKLALQLLIYPGTTAHQDTPSHRTYDDSPVLNKTLIDWFFNNYIDQADRSDWRFAPLLADDVEGVAPAWMGLAECDPLVDEGMLYGDKLRAAGVAVELEIYRGMTHAFAQMSRALPEARQLFKDAGAALKQAFAVN
jgi:acetyl esterase